MWSVGRPGTGPLRLWNPPYYLVFRLRVCRFLPYSRIPYSVPDCVQARTTSHRTRLPDTRMETSGDLRKKLNKAPAPKDSPFAAVAAASPPVPPAAMLTPSIPKDSPFSNSTAAPTTVSQPAAPAKPFTFSFALDTTTQKNTVATYNLAAPIAPVDTSSLQPTVATIGAKNSHKIGRARRGKPRPSDDDEGEEGEDEEEGGGGPSGRSDGEWRAFAFEARQGERYHFGSRSHEFRLVHLRPERLRDEPWRPRVAAFNINMCVDRALAANRSEAGLTMRCECPGKGESSLTR